MKRYWKSILLALLSVVPPFVLSPVLAGGLTAGLLFFAVCEFISVRWGHLMLGQLGSRKKLITICMVWCAIGVIFGFSWWSSETFIMAALGSFLVFSGVVAGLMATGFAVMKD